MPNFAWTPARAPMFFSLHPGTRMIRVHDTGYTDTDFNSRLAPSDDKREGGRFDGTRDHQWAVYYVAVPESAEELAFWETQQGALEIDASSGAQYIFKGKLKSKVFLTVVLTKPVELVDLRGMPQTGAFRTVPRVIHGRNRVRTRAWAAYIREQCPDVHGFIYSSTAAGSTVQGDAIVLFKPIADSSYLDVDSSVSLYRGTGLKRAKRLLLSAGASVR